MAFVITNEISTTLGVEAIRRGAPQINLTFKYHSVLHFSGLLLLNFGNSCFSLCVALVSKPTDASFYTLSTKEEHWLLLDCLLYLHNRTAKGNHPVTFAIAASETQNVNVSVLPAFGLTEGSSTTAKDMWNIMVQVIL